MKKHFLLMFVFCLFPSVVLFSEDEDITNALPLILSKQNAGTEFFITFHPCLEVKSDSNFVRIYVSSKVATNVTLEIPGINFKKVQKTIANGVIEFKLTSAQAQMYSKSDTEPPQPTQVWKARAIHITAEDPVIVYGVTRYKYRSDGFLAIPTSALGTDYIVSSWADPSDNKTQWLTSYTSVVGAYDNTLVTFRAGGGESTGNVLLPNNDILKPNETIKATLSAGDVWLIPGIGSYNDLSGSQIHANKPVAVISGSFCAYIPTWVSGCNFTIEQELPMTMYGSKFHVSPIVDRLKNSWIKIYSKKPQTYLYKDGNEAGMIQTPGGRTGIGYFELVADDGAKRPVVYSSDPGFPIEVVQYNPGQSDDGIPSDPFQMGLVPIELYQNELMFATPGIKGGVGFTKKYINMIYKATKSGSIPDDIEFGSVNNGQIVWVQLNNVDGNPGNQFQDIDQKDGRQYKSKTIKLDSDGVYYLRAKDKIAAYSYGFGDYDSYGFPANFDSRTLEINDTLKPTLEITINNGKEIQGNIYDEPRLDQTKRSNLSNVYLLKSQSTNFNLRRNQIITGQTEKVLWVLTPIDRKLDATALIVAKDYAGNDTIYKFSYIGVPAVIFPPTLISPNNNSTILLNDIKFVWNTVKDAKYHTLEISGDSSFNKNVRIINNIKDTFALVQNFSSDSIYYWRVFSYNDSDTTEFSTVWEFETIKTLPEKPILLAPANDATNQSFVLLFKWKSSANSILYTLEIDNNSDFSSIFATIDTKDTFVTIKDFDRITKYYWRVKAQNSTGKFAYSTVNNYITGNFNAANPILLFPDDASKDVKTDVVFRWSSNQWPSNYQIQIIDITHPGNITIDKQITDTTFSTSLEKSTTYYWKVKSIIQNVESQWSFMRSFQTENNTSVNAQEPQNISISPNPAKDNFEVNYNLVQDSKVRIELFDLNGIKLEELINQFQSSGSYKLNYNSSQLLVGNYLLKTTINDKTFIEKLVIQK